MNLLVLEEDDFTSSDRVCISGPRFKHIKDVLRAQAGDTLRAGRIDGLMGNALVHSINDLSVELDVDLIQPPPAPLPLTLLLALPRPKFLKRILQTVSSLGVKQIYLFNSYRVEKVYWSCEQLSEGAIREACVLGLEQARDTMLPKLHLRCRFKPFLEDEVPALIEGTRAILAHPTSELDCPYQVQTPITLAIGPEGGFIDYEVGHFERAGFETVRLTERILKVETAVTTLIGRLT